MKKGSKISAVALALAAAGAWLILRARSNKESGEEHQRINPDIVAVYAEESAGRTKVNKLIYVYSDGHAKYVEAKSLPYALKKAGLVHKISEEEFAAKLSEYGINA